MKIKLTKLTPSHKKKDHAWADFEINWGNAIFKIKGCIVGQWKKNYFIRLPNLVREQNNVKYSPFCFVTKESAKEFSIKAAEALKKTYPIEKWKNGIYLSYLKK